jgi:sulfur carrier protein ThiS
MVKITVKNINFGEKEIELESSKVSELINKLGTNDDASIFVGDDGEIYTKDIKLRDGSIVNMIEVFSGG